MLFYNYLSLDGILFNPIITFPDTMAHTTQGIYKVGQTVSGKQSFCVKRDVEIEARYFLVDTYIRSYPVKYLHVPPGCYDDKIYEMIPIPEEAHAGEYHIEVQYTAHLNPINTVQWTRVSNDFQVIK